MSSSSASELSPRKTYRLMAAVAIAIILLLALAIYSLSRMKTAPWTSALKPLYMDSAANNQKDLPQFEFIDGNTRLSPDTLRDKWTLLSFWSYSCPPCLEEMPALNQLALTWQGPPLDIVTVNVDKEKTENFDLAKQFLQDMSISLPTLFDRQEILANAFSVREYPRHFLINMQGKLVWDALGAFKWDQQEARDQLLKWIEQQTPEKNLDPAE